MNAHQRRKWRRNNQKYYRKMCKKWELKFQAVPKLTQHMRELNRFNEYVIDQLYKMIWVKP